MLLTLSAYFSPVYAQCAWMCARIKRYQLYWLIGIFFGKWDFNCLQVYSPASTRSSLVCVELFDAICLGFAGLPASSSKLFRPCFLMKRKRKENRLCNSRSFLLFPFEFTISDKFSRMTHDKSAACRFSHQSINWDANKSILIDHPVQVSIIFYFFAFQRLQNSLLSFETGFNFSWISLGSVYD